MVPDSLSRELFIQQRLRDNYLSLKDNFIFRLEITIFSNMVYKDHLFQLASKTLTVKIRLSWRNLIRNIKSSKLSDCYTPTFKLRIPNTVEFLHNDIQTCITFQTRDHSHASDFPLSSLMVCISYKFVMDSAFLEFMCFPAFGVVHFPRSPHGSSCTESNDPHQLGTDFVNVSDRFSLGGDTEHFLCCLL